MIIEYIRYEIAADEAEAFIDAYRAAAKDLDSSPHCLGYELTRGVEEPQRFTVRILWDSVEGHMNGFRRSADFTRFLPLIRPYVPAINEMKHYEVIDAFTKAAGSAAADPPRRPA